MSEVETGYSSKASISEGYIPAPASRIALPQPEHEEMILVRRQEIKRLVRRCGRFGQPSRSARDWALAWLGVAIGLTATLIPMTQSTQKVAAWVIPALAIASGGSYFLFGFCLWFAKDQDKQNSTDIGDIAEELREIEARSPENKST
jgi:hypothetical protein